MTVKLNIPFENVKDAIECASFENHHFIDNVKHEIVFISEYEDDYEKKLEEVNNDDFIGIPARMAEDDFQIMKSFVWTVNDVKAAQKLDDALCRKKPFRNFRKLIDRSQEVRKQWFEHRDKEFFNATMNFLFKNDITLEDNSFMPKIEIKETKREEEYFSEGRGSFGPVACIRCGNTEGFRKRYFELNVSNENMLIDREIKRILKEKFNVEKYGCIHGGEKEIVTASECQKCKSSEIFKDFLE